MKIIQLFYSDMNERRPVRKGLKNEFGQVCGGTEKVAMEIHESLLHYGYESYIVDCKESPYHKEVDNVIQAYGPKSKTAQINNDLSQLAKQFDIVINHNSYSLPKYLNRLGIGYTHIDHLPLTLIVKNKLFYGGFYNEVWSEAKEIGSRFITVSEYALQHKNNFDGRLNPEFQLDGWMQFQYLTEELNSIKVREGGGYGFYLSRCSPERKMNDCEKMTGDFKIVSTGDPSSADKFAKKVKDKIIWNISREETMSMLANASYFFNPFQQESAGISCFEALCSGVPVVLSERAGKHASKMFAPEGAWYVCSSEDTDRIEQYKNLTLAERQMISDEVRSFNPNRAQYTEKVFREFAKVTNSTAITPSLESFMS